MIVKNQNQKQKNNNFIELTLCHIYLDVSIECNGKVFNEKNVKCIINKNHIISIIPVKIKKSARSYEKFCYITTLDNKHYNVIEPYEYIKKLLE